jgi:Holliday junction resolvase RusA-like endonuclease
MAEAAKKVSFVIPGKPVGYYAQAARSKYAMSPDQRKRSEQYRTYCEKVRLYAMQAGFTLPLMSTKEKPISIGVECFFPNGVHADPGNIQKGVCDALFKNAVGGDKHTGGWFEPPRYDAERPRVEVEIMEEDPWQTTMA